DYGTFDWPIKPKPPAIDFAEPLYAWVPSPAISSVAQASDFSDRWNGDLLVGSLKAQTLFRVKLQNDRVILSEPIWIGHRICGIACGVSSQSERICAWLEHAEHRAIGAGDQGGGECSGRKAAKVASTGHRHAIASSGGRSDLGLSLREISCP